MGKKEKAAKQAAFEMQKELDSEMGDEERAAKERAGMGLFGGLNKGEDQLFGTPLRAQALHRHRWLCCRGTSSSLHAARRTRAGR